MSLQVRFDIRRKENQVDQVNRKHANQRLWTGDKTLLKVMPLAPGDQNTST